MTPLGPCGPYGADGGGPYGADGGGAPCSHDRSGTGAARALRGGPGRSVSADATRATAAANKRKNLIVCGGGGGSGAALRSAGVGLF